MACGYSEQAGSNTKYFSNIHFDGTGASLLVRNLRKAPPNSSQRAGLVKADSSPISDDSEKRRNRIQDLQRIYVIRHTTPSKLL
jgi:hypothetical protein